MFKMLTHRKDTEFLDWYRIPFEYLRTANPRNVLKQIQEKHDASQLREAGVLQIVGIGVVVEGKEVWAEWLKWK